MSSVYSQSAKSQGPKPALVRLLRMLTRTEKRTSAQPPSPEPLVVWLRIGRVPVHNALRIATPHAQETTESPVKRRELDSLLTPARSLLKVNSTVFDGSIRHTVVKNTEMSKVSLSPFSPPTFMVPTLPWSGANTVLGKTVNDPRFKLVAEHRVTKLILSQVKPGEVAGVLISIELVYIITCGSICTPQILHNSGLRPYALGRYLTEQSMAFCQIVLSKIHIVSITKFEHHQSGMAM
ncbi:hypothetical protein F5878DRAFT_642059 [Lentinula raphanica]|uniref:Uncharacterized protein n=1 Tax=Lentinula raphanica TaxID=153919 RepID=A0AA38UHD9_9AGAR|nr:hypothetical protein F5878DRAFT_642059 [Lentinula raphanica]